MVPLNRKTVVADPNIVMTIGILDLPNMLVNKGNYYFSTIPILTHLLIVNIIHKFTTDRLTANER